VSYLTEQIRAHRGFVEIERTTWDDPYSHLVAYYDSTTETLHLSAPLTAVFLPSSANLASSDDGEWVFAGLRDSSGGEWIEDRTSDDSGDRLVDNKDDVIEYFGVLFAIEMLRLRPLQRIRLGHIHDLPEIGSHLTWTILTSARDLDHLENLLSDVYSRADGVRDMTEMAQWRDQFDGQPEAVQRTLTGFARGAIKHLRAEGTLETMLGGSTALKMYAQGHVESGCVCIMATNDQGQVVAINMISDEGHALVQEQSHIQSWILDQSWEQLAHEEVPLEPLIAGA
jgi:hypothetical protein